MMDLSFEKIIAGNAAVLVDFYADWCEPCKWVVPVLYDVEKHFDKKITVRKVDIDQHKELCKSLVILSVPTLILFVDGKEVWRMRGFDVAEKLIKTLGVYIK